MDSSIGAILVGIIGAIVAYIGKRKIDSDNETKRLNTEAETNKAKLKIEAEAALADKKRQDDAAQVKLEIEAAAAKVKLETEVALAESERQRERERAQDAKELLEFRAEQDAKLAKQELELEEYRTKRAQTEAAAAALQATVVKELAAMTLGVTATKKAVGTSEKRLSEHITLSSDKVLGGVEKLRELFMLAFDLFLENPPALPDRVDRMMLAFKAGDVVEAQAVADEAPPQVSEEAA